MSANGSSLQPISRLHQPAKFSNIWIRLPVCIRGGDPYPYWTESHSTSCTLAKYRNISVWLFDPCKHIKKVPPRLQSRYIGSTLDVVYKTPKEVRISIFCIRKLKVYIFASKISNFRFLVLENIVWKARYSISRDTSQLHTVFFANYISSAIDAQWSELRFNFVR